MSSPTATAPSPRSVLGWGAALILVNVPAAAFALSVGPLGLVVLGLAIAGTLALCCRMRTVLLELAHHRDDGRRRGAQLAALVEAAADAILTCDEGGQIQDANPAAGRLFGYHREALIGQPLRRLLPVTELDSVQTNQFEVREGAAVQGCREDGTTFPVSVALSKARLEGAALYVVIIHDLTELQRARDEAEAASRAKSAFLLTVSHELRTPLNGILGVADLLARSPLDDGQRALVQTLTRSGEALLSGVEQVLDYSRLESGKLLLERRVFSPRKVFADLERGLGPKAAEKGLRLTVRADVPARLVGDGPRLRQIVEYLTANAIAASPAGEVEVSASAEGATLTVTVRDRGRGLAEAARLDGPADGTGIGLGVSLATRLTRLMGGRVVVESAPGQGTTFHLRVPFEPPGEGAPTGRSALVALPDPVERASIESLLRDLGLEPVGVPTGRAAIDEVVRGVVSGRPFGLVVMDGAISDMPIEDWVRRVGECSGWSGPVVVLRDGPDGGPCPDGVAALVARQDARGSLSEWGRRLTGG